MANDVDQCREMVELSRAARSKMMVGFQMRFHPVVTAVDRLLSRIGPIYHVDFNFSLYRPGVAWRHSLLQGGGVLKELSSHLFDLMQHWAGPVATIAGQNRIIEAGREVEDYSSNQLEFAGGGFRLPLLQLPRSPLAVHPWQPDGVGRADRLSIQLCTIRQTAASPCTQTTPNRFPCRFPPRSTPSIPATSTASNARSTISSTASHPTGRPW